MLTKLIYIKIRSLTFGNTTWPVLDLNEWRTDESSDLICLRRLFIWLLLSPTFCPFECSQQCSFTSSVPSLEAFIGPSSLETASAAAQCICKKMSADPYCQAMMPPETYKWATFEFHVWNSCPLRAPSSPHSGLKWVSYPFKVWERRLSLCIIDYAFTRA